jgi:hypothetical protein
LLEGLGIEIKGKKQTFGKLGQFRGLRDVGEVIF